MTDAPRDLEPGSCRLSFRGCGRVMLRRWIRFGLGPAACREPPARPQGGAGAAAGGCRIQSGRHHTAPAPRSSRQSPGGTTGRSGNTGGSSIDRPYRGTGRAAAIPSDRDSCWMQRAEFHAQPICCREAAAAWPPCSERGGGGHSDRLAGKNSRPAANCNGTSPYQYLRILRAVVGARRHVAVHGTTAIYRARDTSALRHLEGFEQFGKHRATEFSLRRKASGAQQRRSCAPHSYL